MDRQLPPNLPPEFLAAMMGGGAGAPIPPLDPMAAMGGAPMPPLMGGMPGPQIGGGIAGNPTTFDAQQPPDAWGDPVLASMLGASDLPNMVPDLAPKGPKHAKPDVGDVLMYANLDKGVWNGRNDRISRDISIFRQFEGGIPSDFDPEVDTQFLSAAMSNLVNRLANMMGGLNPVFEAPYRDEQTEDFSQSIENFGYWSRGLDRRYYARSQGGNLQRDEFFFLLLHGAIAARILPDVDDTHYPFVVSVLDPSTVYPTWGGPKQGLVRVIRVYNSTVAEIVSTYGTYNKRLERELMEKFGTDTKSYGEYLNHQVELVEYYDEHYRGVVTRDGIEVLKIQEHGYDFVPFIYITAVGEPRAMQTPGGRYSIQTKYGTKHQGVTSDEEQREKGVSVLHYLINTHRLREAIFTLLYAEIEKSSDPPTVRYRAPQLMKQDIPDFDTKRGGKNAAYMGLENIEGIPTSPRPTDVAPVLQTLSEDFTAGSLNQAAQGMEQGSNPSGYSLDTLIATAKELILPYLQAYENYLSLQLEIKLRFYRDLIAPMVPLRIPNKPLYGASNALSDLTVEAINAVGVNVTVKMKNITDQNLPMLAQTAQVLMSTGLYSQRAAMDFVGVANPDKMFADILAEKALQHPLIMELFAIPGALKARGADELADVWSQTVGMQALMSSGMAGGGTPALGAGGTESPPPSQGGGPNPASGSRAGPPTGPEAGQGRGPAQ